MTPLDWQTLTEFVRDVVGALRRYARELSKEPGVRGFSSLLAAVLQDVEERLGELSSCTRTDVEERRLLELLDKLDVFCQWPSPLPHLSRPSNLFGPERWPSTIHILRPNGAGKELIRSVAINRRAGGYRMRLVKDLLEFCQLQQKCFVEPENSELLGQDITQPQRDDHGKYIGTLYDTLAAYSMCQGDGGQKEIIMNLRLNDCCSPGEITDSVSFRLFILGHPHGYDNVVSWWQDAQICVLRKGQVRFETEEAAFSLTRVTMDSFCNLITERNHVQLKFAALNDSLLLKGCASHTDGFFLGASSISLAALLDRAKLTQKMKLLLQSFLAKAFWQFYDSKWMQNEWTKETVHFMAQRRSELAGIYVNEPFLSAQFDNYPKSQDDIWRTHHFPKILSLGIMFLEIELNCHIENHRTPDCLTPNGQPHINTDQMAAKMLLEKSELWREMETYSASRGIFEACITPDLFEPYLNDADRLRDTFEKIVVNPLQQLYDHAWGEPDIYIPALPIADSSRPIISDKYSQPLLHLSSSSSRLPDNAMSNSTRTPSSDDWFDHLDLLNSLLRAKPNERDDHSRPTRIAVLDTGVRADCVDESSIKSYKDFVSKKNDWQDNTGHGTNVVRLIGKVYSNAAIYVGRVFEDSQATASTAFLMVQAIRYAKDVWKADIIVMLCGFSTRYQDMMLAINEAEKERILVFAAPSNSGNSKDPAFPANLYIDQQLLCMFSTDANTGNPSTFNPQASSKAAYNFAIIGENIVLPHVDQPLVGTSFATAIGAAIAGRILDFSRHTDIRGKIRCVKRLTTVNGISAVFAKMLPESAVNGYHCIHPWRILPPSGPDVEPEKDMSEGRAEKRGHVAETISRVLETLNFRYI